MNDVAPAMYAGLDQMIARATTPGKREQPEKKPPAEKPDGEARQPLVPSEPKPLALYRKQTFCLGPDELHFIEHAMQTMQAQYKHEVFKNEIVRCALELLAKDFDINKDKSFLVRKFVRR